MSTVRAELLKLVTLPALALTAGLTVRLTALLALVAAGSDPIPYVRASTTACGCRPPGRWRSCSPRL